MGKVWDEEVVNFIRIGLWEEKKNNNIRCYREVVLFWYDRFGIEVIIWVVWKIEVIVFFVIFVIVGIFFNIKVIVFRIGLVFLIFVKLKN